MKDDKINEKEAILKELVNSGINITPSTLEILLNLDEPLEKVKLIIKKVSFLPNFNSHLTEEILQNISKEEIQKSLKNVLIKKTASTTLQDKNLKESNKFEILGSINTIEHKKKKPKSPEIYVKSGQLKNQLEPTKDNIIINNYHEKSSKELIKNKHKLAPFERSKSSLRYEPIAKEIDLSFEILKDPTGKLYTSGNYEDFYNLTVDKFKKLRNLMRKRPEVLTANNINNILRLTNKVEVSVIGLVEEIRITKNGNFFISLEDLTNKINVIIRKDSENQENVKIAERTLNDQMVYVEGTYTPGEKGKSGIIYCNYIYMNRGE